MKHSFFPKFVASIGIGVIMLGLTGCQWVGFTNNVTPQVSGRIIAADTQQPLAGVQVSRVFRGQPINPSTPPNGAQLLLQDRPVVTDAQGNFVYPSQSYLTLLKSATWWSLRLSFQAKGYITVQTNFTVTEITGHTADGTPLIDTGNISLRPLN